MKQLIEKPFEHLRKKSGEHFDTAVIRNLYIARAYALKLLKDITLKHRFMPGDDKRLHVVFDGTDARMLTVARQIAMSAHFANFQEEAYEDHPANRTVLSFVTHESDIKQRLSQEEFLGNLPLYCKIVNADGSVENEHSFIDIEIHICPEIPGFHHDEVGLVINNAEVAKYFDSVPAGDDSVFSIDTSKAYYTNQMYRIGETIDNLPYEDIHDTNRYAMALNIYQFVKLKSKPEPMFEAEPEPCKQHKVLEALSNIFCSDCFELRINSLQANSKAVTADWLKHNKALSVSEHARWSVEKLIMGYRPLNADERFHDECLRIHIKSKERLKKYRESLKRTDSILAHVDLCSYRDLRRINPDNLKYDSFLMLSIPKILGQNK